MPGQITRRHNGVARGGYRGYTGSVIDIVRESWA